MVAQHDCDSCFQTKAEVTLFLRMQEQNNSENVFRHNTKSISVTGNQVAEANGEVSFLTGNS